VPSSSALCSSLLISNQFVVLNVHNSHAKKYFVSSLSLLTTQLHNAHWVSDNLKTGPKRLNFRVSPGQLYTYMLVADQTLSQQPSDVLHIPMGALTSLLD
jgi:hypothetical protein